MAELDARIGGREIPMNCVRCDGTGLIEYTSGRFPTGYYLRGELVVEEREASEDRPIYRRCSCRDERPRVAPEPRVYD